MEIMQPFPPFSFFFQNKNGYCNYFKYIVQYILNISVALINVWYNMNPTQNSFMAEEKQSYEICYNRI